MRKYQLWKPMHDPGIEREVSGKIREELFQLAAFYQFVDSQTLDILKSIDLSHYVEVVVNTTGFELVVGGIHREKELIASAKELGYPNSIIESFEHFTQCFPDKMLYSKLCFGLDSSPPSLYLCITEPWDKVLSELEKLPGMDQISAHYQVIASQRKMCFLLGFSLDKDSQFLSAKTYHLAPFPKGPAHSAPFLLSNRYSQNTLLEEEKSYMAGVSWDDFGRDNNWETLIQAGKEIFGTEYGMFLGLSREGEKVGKKGYILRFDKRENENYSLKTYNYYAEEGAQLMKIGDYPAAIDAFSESIAFHRDSPEVLAELYNMRGTLYYGLRKLNEAKADIQKAIELNEHMASAHNNLSAVYMQFREYEKAVFSAGRALYLDPASDATNLTMAKRLLRQAEMHA